MITIGIICRQQEDLRQIFGLLSLQKDFSIVCTGRDGYDALSRAAPLKPDVLIMDLRLPDIEGPELALILKRKSPSTSLMVFSSEDGKDLVFKSIKAGISAFLLKERDMGILTDIVRIIFSGSCYVSAPIITSILSNPGLDTGFGEAAKTAACQAENSRIFRFFSPSERQVIIHLAQGYSDQEIADKLNIIQGTVRNCLSRVRRKTGLKSRTQIVMYALLYGLISFNQIDIYKIYPD